MRAKKPLDLDSYRRMQQRNMDYELALARTNMAVRCWLRWAGALSTDVEELRGKHRRVLAWLLANHLVQAYYRNCGIDIRPFSVGGMYGYGYAVGARSPVCLRDDLGETAWVACGSVRVDPKGEVGNNSFELAGEVARGEDPLWAIDRAAVAALGQRWVKKCPYRMCLHKKHANIYLAVYQIITLLLAMGYLSDAILGTYVDCGEYGVNPVPTHPLRLAGLVSMPCFTQEYFELGPTYRTNEPFAWIHRSTGDLLIAGDLGLVHFEDWCGGSVDRGLEFLCARIVKT